MRTAWLLGVAVVALGACSKQHPETTRAGRSILAHIPADAPYAMATLGPLPDDYIDLYYAENRPKIASLKKKLREAEDSGQGWARTLLVLVEELESKFSRSGFHEIGIDVWQGVSVYGLGIMPVARLELTDPPAFRAFLERVLARAGTQVARGDVRGRSVWRFELDASGNATLVFMMDGSDLVITVAPAARVAATLDRLLADGRSMLDSGELERVARDHGLSRSLVGLVDTARVLGAIADDRELLVALGADMPQLGPPCREELGALAATMPRWVFGIEEAVPGRLRGAFIMELRPELARDLMAARVAVPGVGAPLGEDVITFALAADLPKLLDAVRAEAGRVARVQRRCPALLPIGRGAGEMAAELARPMPVWASLRGLVVALTSASMTLGIPQVKGYGLIASIDPTQLLDLARQAFPGLSDLKVPEDGTPVALPPGLVPFLPEAHLAMRGKLLGFSLGAAMQPALVRLMGAAPHAARPLLSVSYDLKRLRDVVTAIAGAESAEGLEGDGTMSVLIEVTERGIVARGERRYGAAARP